jgi:DNA-binding MarR family transcriptional regulator
MPGDGNLAETVKLLDTVAGKDAPNQRTLANRIGISVGLLNALVNRAARKGLIKIKEAPARRYVYYLTPKGLAEKSRLVAQYLDYSLKFFRTARQDYDEVFAHCEAIGRKRIILCGAGELAEIATLAAHGRNVELVAVLDHETNHTRIAGLPVVRDLAALEADDVVVITDGRKPQEVYERLAAAIAPERVLAPTFLRISLRVSQAGEENVA